MGDAILALNAGSSSVKFGLYAVDRAAGVAALAKGVIETRDGASRLTASDPSGRALADEASLADKGLAAGAEETLDALLDWTGPYIPGGTLLAVGHRVVHGGEHFVEPVRLTTRVIADLDALTPLAPLHQPHNLAPIRTLAAIRPGLPQVACFDTAFHRAIRPPASRYALPRAYEAEGMRRYGFHGLSYEYIAGRLAELPRRPRRRADGRRASRQRRQPVRHGRRGGASTPRWASPPSTDSSWGPGPARSTRASSSTSCRRTA